MTGTAVVPATPVAEPRSVRVLRPVAAPAELISAQNESREFVMQVLEKGGDYGKIPGIEKPTLLKPGAEKVTLAFGCAAVPKIIEREIDHDRTVRWIKRKAKWETVNGKRQRTGEEVTEGESIGLYRYVVEVQIVDANGEVRGSGFGSCSSAEAKYVDRPRESENTILKMAVKRAHVAAVLATFGLSQTFTQDVEEMSHLNESAGASGNGNGGESEGGGLFPMPFGPSKGTALADMETDDLTGALKWAKGKGKFEEFQEAAIAELRSRRSRAAAPADPEGPSDRGPDSADGPDDDGLPF